MKMKKGSSALLVVFLLSVALAISACVMPAFAKINYKAGSIYDFGGDSLHYGEEIHVRLTIDPGENPAHNISIDISEVDALIDDNSFVETRLPAGVPVTLTQEGHTFFYDRLEKGESIKLEFNAYPKTIGKKEINAVNVVITYDQLGDRLDEKINVNTALENSTWFKYEHSKGEISELQSRIQSINQTFYTGIAFIVVGILVGGLFFLAWLREKRTREIKIGEQLHDFVNYLKGLKKRGEEKKIDRDIIRDIEDKKEDIEMEKEYNKYKERYEKYEGE